MGLFYRSRGRIGTEDRGGRRTTISTCISSLNHVPRVYAADAGAGIKLDNSPDSLPAH